MITDGYTVQTNPDAIRIRNKERRACVRDGTATELRNMHNRRISPLMNTAQHGLCIVLLMVTSGLGCQVRCQVHNGAGSDAGVSCSCAGTPACDAGGTERCARHTDCESRACLPDSTCANAADVAYVKAAAPDTAPCTRAAPCGHISTALTTAGRSGSHADPARRGRSGRAGDRHGDQVVDLRRHDRGCWACQHRHRDAVQQRAKRDAGPNHDPQ